MNDVEQQKLVLRDIADLVKNAANPNGGDAVGFAMFLAHNEGVSYVSNGIRENVVESLEEWLEKTPNGLDAGPQADPDETPRKTSSRLALEHLCGHIGLTITQVAKVGLFLFDFGEGGNMAYFTSLPNFRECVANWVRFEKAKK